MVFIVAETAGSRLSYAAELVFGRILLLPYRIIGISEIPVDTDDFILHYLEKAIPGSLTVPCSGFLERTGTAAPEMEVIWDGYPRYFAFPTADPDLFPFDIFAATFWIATEYEKYSAVFTDSHDRYDERRYSAMQDGWIDRPLLHLYALELLKRLPISMQVLSDDSRKYSYQFTFDIDNPWKYKHRGSLIQTGGMVRALMRGGWASVRERMKLWTSGHDPFNTYEWIMDYCPKEKTTFFFLVGTNSHFDSRYSARTGPYRMLIEGISRLGFRIGIHPSYETPQNASLLRHEKWILKEAAGKAPTRSRQHFLRYKLPGTFRNLIECGISEDFTLCPVQQGGFRTGMAVAYPWYDLKREEETPLLLHPTMVMDRTLEKYMGLDPESARDKAAELVDRTKEVGGTFTLLLHNESLSESDEWKGWRMPLMELINYIKRPD